jgi:lysozyme
VVEQALKQWQADEGYKQHPYKDTKGILSIGYGRNLEAVGVTRLEADYMARNDLYGARLLLDAVYPWWRDCNDARCGVLMMMMANMGAETFAEFKTFLGFMKAGEWQKAVDDLRGTSVFAELGARYERYCQIIISGQWL